MEKPAPEHLKVVRICDIMKKVNQWDENAAIAVEWGRGKTAMQEAASGNCEGIGIKTRSKDRGGHLCHRKKAIMR